MRAISVIPGRPNSIQLVDMPQPPAADGSVVAATLAVGVCGTDVEIVSGRYGWTPPGSDRLVLAGC